MPLVAYTHCFLANKMLPRQLKTLLREVNIPENDCSDTLAKRAASQVNTYIRVVDIKLIDTGPDPHHEDDSVNKLLQHLNHLQTLAQADAHC